MCIRDRFYGLLKLLGGTEHKVFTQNVGGSVLDALNGMLTDIRRVYVFGEPFSPLQPGNIGCLLYTSRCV